jgi:hypothetical protein
MLALAAPPSNDQQVIVIVIAIVIVIGDSVAAIDNLVAALFNRQCLNNPMIRSFGLLDEGYRTDIAADEDLYHA